MRRLFSAQDGSVMVLALVTLASGSLMVTPFLSRVSDGAIHGERYEEDVVTQYSSYAAVEDGLWNVSYGDFSTTVLGSSGDTTTFPSGEPVNGVQPTVTIIRDWVQYAVDDFESGGWSGGTGWSAPWTTSGDAVVQTAEAPHEGSYHLRLRNAGTTARSTSLSNIFDAHLYFWSRVDGFNPNDSVRLLFSADGTNWTTARTWTNADNNTSYVFNDFDLAAYGDSAQFWVKFESNLGGASRQFFVDHIVVATPLPGASLGLPRDPSKAATSPGAVAGWRTGLRTATRRSRTTMLRTRDSTTCRSRPSPATWSALWTCRAALICVCSSGPSSWASKTLSTPRPW